MPPAVASNEKPIDAKIAENWMKYIPRLRALKRFRSLDCLMFLFTFQDFRPVHKLTPERHMCVSIKTVFLYRSQLSFWGQIWRPFGPSSPPTLAKNGNPSHVGKFFTSVQEDAHRSCVNVSL